MSEKGKRIHEEKYMLTPGNQVESKTQIKRDCCP